MRSRTRVTRCTTGSVGSSAGHTGAPAELAVSQRAQHREVLGVILGAARCLDQDGHAAGHRVSEQLSERLGPDAALADPLVTVAQRAARVTAVVGMHESEPVAA